MERSADGILAHYGVPGMKWGKRNARSAGSSSSSKGKKAPKEDIKSLSDQELRQRLNRIQMEKQYAALTRPAPNKALKVSTDLLSAVGKQAVGTLALKYTSKGLDRLVSEIAKKI